MEPDLCGVGEAAAEKRDEECPVLHVDPMTLEEIQSEVEPSVGHVRIGRGGRSEGLRDEEASEVEFCCEG